MRVKIADSPSRAKWDSIFQDIHNSTPHALRGFIDKISNIPGGPEAIIDLSRQMGKGTAGFSGKPDLLQQATSSVDGASMIYRQLKRVGVKIGFHQSASIGSELTDPQEIERKRHNAQAVAAGGMAGLGYLAHNTYAGITEFRNSPQYSKQIKGLNAALNQKYGPQLQNLAEVIGTLKDRVGKDHPELRSAYEAQKHLHQKLTNVIKAVMTKKENDVIIQSAKMYAPKALAATAIAGGLYAGGAYLKRRLSAPAPTPPAEGQAVELNKSDLSKIGSSPMPGRNYHVPGISDTEHPVEVARREMFKSMNPQEQQDYVDMIHSGRKAIRAGTAIGAVAGAGLGYRAGGLPGAVLGVVPGYIAGGFTAMPIAATYHVGVHGLKGVPKGHQEAIFRKSINDQTYDGPVLSFSADTEKSSIKTSSHTICSDEDMQAITRKQKAVEEAAGRIGKATEAIKKLYSSLRSKKIISKLRDADGKAEATVRKADESRKKMLGVREDPEKASDQIPPEEMAVSIHNKKNEAIAEKTKIYRRMMASGFGEQIKVASITSPLEEARAASGGDLNKFVALIKRY